MENIINFSEDKIRILNLTKKERKKFHQFIESQYPQIHKTSIHCSCFPADKKCIVKKCWNCDKKVPIRNYSMGSLTLDGGSNQDEYYYGDCPRCFETKQI